MRSRELWILVSSVTLTYVFFLFLSLVKPAYLSLYNTEPLALTNTLFPVASIIAALFVLLCFICFYYEINNKFIHIAVLLQFAFVMWYTPAFMSNYVYGLDTLTNAGVVPYLPSILQGHINIFTTYAQNYPASFVFYFSSIKILGTDVINFSRIINPLYWILTFILFSYVITRRFLKNSSIAFITTVLVTLGITKLEFYPTPSATGVLLVLTVLFMVLFYSGNKNLKILSFLPIIVLVIAHPESPILLLILLLAPFIVMMFTRTKWRLPFTLFLPLSIFAIALFWASGAVQYGWSPIVSLAQRIQTLTFITGIGQTATTVQTIYPFYSNLRAYIIYSFGISAILLACTNLRIRKNIKAMIGTLVRSFSKYQLTLLVISFLLVFVIFAFGLTVDPIIRQRAQIYLILALSGFIGSIIFTLFYKPYSFFHLSQKTTRKLAIFLMAVMLVSIAFLYPLASYYDMALYSAPQAEGAGLNFMGTYLRTNGQTVFSYRSDDLALAMGQNANLTLYDLPTYKDLLPSNLQSILEDKQSLSDSNTSIVIFRQSVYYELSMQNDYSFSNNAFTALINHTSSSPLYAEIYSNPSLQIYINEHRTGG